VAEIQSGCGKDTLLKMKRIFYACGGLILLMWGLLILVGFVHPQMAPLHPPGKDSTPPFPLKATARVLKRPIQAHLMESGIVGYLESYSVHAEVGGQLQACYVKPGQKVKRGEVLLKMENPLLSKTRQKINARVEEAQKDLNHFHRFVSKEMQEEMEIQLEQARDTFQNARKALQNAEALFQRGMIAKNNWIKAQKDQALAERVWRLTQLKFEQQKEKQKKALAHREATLQLARQEQSEVEEKIAQLTIKAPVSGLVLKMSPQFPTDYWSSNVFPLNRGQFLLTIVRGKGRSVELYLFESEIARLHPGDALTLHSDLYPDKIIAGKVSQIGLDGEPYGQYLRFPVRIEVLSEEVALNPGSYVRCRFLMASRENALSIPISFLFYQDGKKFCRVWHHQEIQEVAVRPGIDDGTFVEILEGLQENERVCSQ